MIENKKVHTMNRINKFFKIILSIIIVTIIIGCRGQSYTLSVDYTKDGRILINDEPLEMWLTRKPVIIDNKTTMYFLDLSHEKYKLQVKLKDGSLIDTFFVVSSGESYYGINLRSGELYGFEFK